MNNEVAIATYVVIFEGLQQRSLQHVAYAKNRPCLYTIMRNTICRRAKDRCVPSSDQVRLWNLCYLSDNVYDIFSHNTFSDIAILTQ